MRVGVEPAVLTVVLAAGMAMGLRYLDRRSEQIWARQEERLTDIDGRLMLQTGEMQLQLATVTRMMPELKEQLHAMRIDLKRVEEVQATTMRTEREVTTRIRDSVVYDTVRQQPERVRVFDYRDDYLRVKGVARGDSQWMQVSVRDTLLQVVHRGRRTKPWLWIFSPRELVQTVRLSNPHAEIGYSRRIEISK